MSQPVANGPVLSRTAFTMAWTLASLVPWIMTTLLWCVGSAVPIADNAAEIFYGANAGEGGAERAYQILYAAAFFSGHLLTLLIEVRLLRQFRDGTRWWLYAALVCAATMIALAVIWYLIVGKASVHSRWTFWIAGRLAWTVASWFVVRAWGWHHRNWLLFSAVLPSRVRHLCSSAAKRGHGRRRRSMT